MVERRAEEDIPRALGRELKPLQSWLQNNGLSEPMIDKVIFGIRVYHLGVRRDEVFHRQLPEIGISGLIDQMGTVNLKLHITYPQLGFTDESETMFKQRFIITDGLKKAASEEVKNFKIDFELVPRQPIEFEGYIGLLKDTKEEEAQFHHGMNLAKVLNEKYMPIFEASEELNRTYNELVFGFINKSIDEQEKIANQLTTLASNIRQVIDRSQQDKLTNSK